MKKIVLLLILVMSVTLPMFSLSEYMKDAVFALKPTVKDFSDVGIRESIVDGRAAAPSPLDLKVGDIFVDVNGNAQKVTKIVKSGKNISIETTTPEIQEVFTYIRVPDQATDFMQYYEEDASAYSARSAQRSIADIPWSEGQMLDALMPKGECKYFDFTVNIKSWDVSESTKKFQDQIERIEDAVDQPWFTGDQAQKNAAKNFTNQLRNKNTNRNKSVNLDLTIGVRYKGEKNLLDYGFDYSLPHWDTHDSWWPKNWSWNGGGGYVKFDYVNDIDLGFSIDTSFYFYDQFSAPLPGLCYGSTSFGPYVGVYFDATFAGGATIGYNYYKHLESRIRYRKDFDAIFRGVGTPVNEVDVWDPSAHYGYGTLDAELNFGPAIKVGFVALGMKLAQGSVFGGGYLEGEIGFGYTHYDFDESDYKKFHGNDQTKMHEIFYEHNENPKQGQKEWELKYPEGSTFIGDVAVGAFFKVAIEAWDGKFYVYPVDYKLPLLTHHGWVNEFELDGANWFVPNGTNDPEDPSDPNDPNDPNEPEE